MESIEHTKLKPLTLPLIVDKTQRILAVSAGKSPAKEKLARKSILKYGKRESQSTQLIKELPFLNEVKRSFDLMFALNQRCAKLRSDIKRLVRLRGVLPKKWVFWQDLLEKDPQII